MGIGHQEMNEHGPILVGLPDWVPDGARRYLAHTEAGQSIRTLARQADVHASTILRQVRRIETRRDDPLVDAALKALAQATRFGPTETGRKGSSDMTCAQDQNGEQMQSLNLERESCRILRRLCETGAVLAVAEKMEKAVVVRDCGPNGDGARTAVVDRTIAQAMALQDWIYCDAPGRISRYRITAAGRTALGRMLAETENRARSQKENGFAEAQTGFAPQQATGQGARRLRYNAAESPLSALARRKDRDGQPFLTPELVQAGERLREDFELAQMGPKATRNWDQLAPGGSGFDGPSGGTGDGCARAHERMTRAMEYLGEGLADVALRCCCYLEGLEVAEKRMGWSARSGKIVLRIALQRLHQHYQSTKGTDRLIG